MAKMQRPCWTIAFGFICVLVIPGAILTHKSVAELIPEISDLPANIVKGFDQVFKFAYLEQDSKTVKTSAATALNQCAVVNAAATCPTFTPNPALAAQQQNMNAVAARTSIKNAFATSLSVVSTIANDKYFGTADLKKTADNLNKMTVNLNKIKDTMKCYEAIPTFCAIHQSADGLVSGMAMVNKALDMFKNSDMVKQWEKNKGLLQFMHALPYAMVLSLFFFALFWCKGGVCCCCRGGSACGTLALIPSILLWLLSFIIFLVVFAVGVSVKHFSDKIAVPVLNGSPTLNLAIAHIQTSYPEFWKVVFSKMETGLDGLLLASYFFVGVSLLQMFYSCFEICCCPYRKKAEADAEQPAVATADASKTIMAPAEAAEKPAETPAAAPAETPAAVEEGEHSV